MKIRLCFRGWRTGEQKPVFVELTEMTKAEFDSKGPAMAAKHVKRLGRRGGMIEVEFLDEPDPQQRFLRFGTDPSRMVLPIEIKHD